MLSGMTSDDRLYETLIRRREALAALGAGAGALLLAGRAGGFPFGTPEAAAAGACSLDPEVTEGPYWIDNSLTRRDIREDRRGLLLKLGLTVVTASTCKAISGADVELWHADASGLYSGFGSSPGQGTTNTKRYLRGHQKAGSDGKVTFFTIYPGWYRGRTPHIHVKVHVGGNVVHTGQLFFADSASSKVYDTASYKSHGEPDTTNASDTIYKQAGGAAALVTLNRRSSTSLAKGFNGSSVLAVHT
jgi:protocatechuate 3,4-dioxygenase beta subunit